MLSSVTAPPSRRPAATRRPRIASPASGGVPLHSAAASLSSLFSKGRSRQLLVLVAAICCLGSISLIPILILEKHSGKGPQRGPSKASLDHVVLLEKRLQGGHGGESGQVAVMINKKNDSEDRHPLVRFQKQMENEKKAAAAAAKGNKNHAANNNNNNNGESDGHHHAVGDLPNADAIMVPPLEDNKQPQDQGEVLDSKEKRGPPKYTLKDLPQDDPDVISKLPLARGVAGLPLRQTPALQGAKRPKIHCTFSKEDDRPFHIDSLAYWNDPQGEFDRNFKSPFAVQSDKTRYLTFNPDRGGWNNVRMSMEVIFVLAAVTGRTLVLPPKEPLYLLNKAKQHEERHRGFADFFPLENNAAFAKNVPLMSTTDFLAQPEIKSLLLANVPNETMRQTILDASDHCDHMRISQVSCTPLRGFLEIIGTVPNISATTSCVIFDEAAYRNHGDPSSSTTSAGVERVKQYCGPERSPFYWDAEVHEDPLILHFKADDKHLRLLAHFYNMIYFTNPVHDNHYKRFVRDFLHYQDTIFCAAGKIIKALEKEAKERGQSNADGTPSYSAMHVRRGDLQYKRVKISAKEWYENTKEAWKPGELMYIATDERNKGFFNDLAKHHDLRFLDDYWDLAHLSDLDGNYMGMIDTIVASRGRAFAGTWFSTFTGYINRMRGYHGMSMHDSWYSFLPKKTENHEWPVVNAAKYAYEWPDGWVGIDGDEFPSRDVF